MSQKIPPNFDFMASLRKYLEPPKLPDLTGKLAPPITVQQADSFQKGIKEVIEKLESRLAKDEQLFVYYTNGVEIIRVAQVYMSSTNVAVISGVDQNGNETRVVAHFQALQFVCKIMKVSEEKPRRKIGFVIDTPTQKST